MTRPFHPDILKMGYFILYKNDGSKLGNLIARRQLVEGYIPSHAQFIHIEVSGGGRHSVNIVWPKAKLIDITKAHKGRHIRVIRYKNEHYERKGRYKVAYFSATLCNKPYDWNGVLAFVIKFIKQNKNHPFCSEGAAWALQMEYPKVFMSATPSSIMPASFNRPAEFEVVWEGVIP